MSFICKLLKQCRKPSGLFGRIVARGMNLNHASMTRWGLEHVNLREDMVALDIGCGGGGTVYRLASILILGKVYGIDYSKESVKMSQKVNLDNISKERVDIRQGSVSELPFQDDMFDLITAVETHYFWPDLTADLREILRVLKPLGIMMMIGGEYKGGKFDQRNEKWVEYGNMTYLTINEHRKLLEKVGYKNVCIHEDYERGWMCAVGQK